MQNIIDLVQLRTSSAIKRETIENIINLAITITKEHLDQGFDVYWAGFVKFNHKTVKPRKKKNTEPAIETTEEAKEVVALLETPNIKATIVNNPMPEGRGF